MADCFSDLAVAPLVAAFGGEKWLHHAPFKPDMRHAFQKPCLEYPFGTDNLGRCVFCRIIKGSRTSIFSALFVVLIVLQWGRCLAQQPVLQVGSGKTSS
ncbi:MAG: hypothetical protein ACLR6B_04875 [Blautia sp.]